MRVCCPHLRTTCMRSLASSMESLAPTGAGLRLRRKRTQTTSLSHCSLCNVLDGEKSGLLRNVGCVWWAMDKKDEVFFPSGSIAFFVALMVLYGVIWQGMYLLTILRR